MFDLGLLFNWLVGSLIILGILMILLLFGLICKIVKEYLWD
jgi:hypothetical protein